MKARRLLRIRCGSPGLFLQVSGDFGELGEGGLEVFDDVGGDDFGGGKVGGVFEGGKARPLLHPRYGVFEPELSRREAANQTGRRGGWLSEGKRRNQDVEVDLIALD